MLTQDMQLPCVSISEFQKRALAVISPEKASDLRSEVAPDLQDLLNSLSFNKEHVAGLVSAGVKTKNDLCDLFSFDLPELCKMLAMFTAPELGRLKRALASSATASMEPLFGSH